MHTTIYSIHSVMFFFCSLLFILLQGIASKVHHNNGNHLAQKLHAISAWLDGRSDSTIYDYIYHVNAGAGLNLFEGDIKDYHRRLQHITKVAISNTMGLWNTRVVPYRFHPEFQTGDRQAVLDAIADFHNKTCIRFVPRTTEKDYVTFRQLNGCFSNIGRQGGEQNVSLASDCLKKGTAIHELMHAVGFFHEQNRPDRDSWVRVIHTNIEPDKTDNFEKLRSWEVNTLGIRYDYGSVMHYSKTAFSRNGNPTILPIRDTVAEIGQRHGFSHLDISKVNKLYRCGDILPGQTAVPPTLGQYQSNPLLVMTNIQTHSCQSNGWLPWSKWSRCDLNCQQQRERFCRPECSDLRDCPGTSREVQNCQSQCRRAFYIGCWRVDPSNMTITSVGDFRGGATDQLEIVRRCADIAAANGFSVFAMFNQTKCLTDDSAYRTFSSLGVSKNCGISSMGGTDAISVYTYEKHINGSWGPWGSWQQCDHSCEGGKQYRYRLCNSPPPVGDGLQCQGEDEEHQECNTQKCVENPLCGRKFYTSESGEGGIIYLNDYNNSMECNYEIETRPLFTISLLISKMDIELSAGCQFDALSVFDGENSTSLIGVHCGNINPYPMISSSNKVKLKFQSDATITGAGFTMYYTINNGQRKTCIEPVPTAHCSVTYTTHFVGDTVTYQCHHGYHFKNPHHPATLVCLDQPAFAVWSDFFPVCVRAFRASTSLFSPKFCDFEGNFCGFSQSDQDNFDWWIEKPKITQQEQLPRLDSKNSTKGHFLYTESLRHLGQGDYADVISKTYSTQKGRQQCLSFSYSVYGKDESILKVYVKDMTTTYLSQPFAMHASLQDDWRRAIVQIYPENNFQIIFRFKVGIGFGSSAAIDDIQILQGSCQQSY
ncbi:tolloid-like protein 1 [Crassostrea virginica]